MMDSLDLKFEEKCNLESEYQTYVERIFTELNGRPGLNQNHLADLEFQVNSKPEMLAHTMFDKVVMFLSNIVKKIDKLGLNNISDFTQAVHQQIVLTIVHELSHIEQDINYDRYDQDESYRELKENENNFNAYSFILSNLTSIENISGAMFDRNWLYNKLSYYNKYDSYKKLNNFEWYMNALKTILMNDKNKDLIYKQIDSLNMNYNITVRIDSDPQIPSFIISKNGICYPQDQYNGRIRFLTETYFYMTKSYSVTKIEDYGNNDILIDIKIALKGHPIEFQ